MQDEHEDRVVLAMEISEWATIRQALATLEVIDRAPYRMLKDVESRLDYLVPLWSASQGLVYFDMDRADAIRQAQEFRLHHLLDVHDVLNQRTERE